MDTTNEFIAANFQEMTDSEMAAHTGVSAKAVKNRRHRMQLFKGKANVAYNATETDAIVTDIEKAMQEVGEVSAVSLTKYVSVKDKGPDEPPETTTNYTTRVSVAPPVEPMWQHVTQAPPIEVHPVDVTQVDRDMQVAVILPDPQIGYRLDPRTHEFDPFHDEHAMNVALQIIQDLQPDKVVNLGDYLDLPQYGRFAQEPFFAHTSQPAIDRGSSFLAEQRASAPDSEIVVIQGNHDKRLTDYLKLNAMAAWGITRANAAKHEPPVMSIPFLLRFDEIGVQYVDGYPGGEYYINNHLKCIHGKRTGRKTRIAPTVIEDEKISTITGHNHHIEVAYRTVHKREGLFEPFAAILGCLCRIDGVVPSVHSSLGVDGAPLRNYEDWQQAIGVVYYTEDDPNPQLDIIRIFEGRAIFQGREYVSNF